MFKKIFIDLCNSKKEAPTAVCMKVGLSNATFSCWTDTSVPRKATLQRIADYFEVSVDYLLGKEEIKKPTKNIAQDANNLRDDFLSMFDSKHSDTDGVFLGAPKPQSAPVYESLSAAFGKAESGKIIDYRFIDVPGEEEAKRTLFAQINDDSMAPQIKSGALVQILRVDSVDSGAIAAVAVQMLGREEILIRKVIYGHGWVELQSINQKEPSLKFIREGIDNVRILGRVVDIILLNKGV